MKTKGISIKRATNHYIYLDYFTLQALQTKPVMLPRKTAVGHLVTLYINTSSLRWWSLSKQISKMLNTDMKEKEASRREKVSHYPAKNPFNSRLLNFNQDNQFPSSPVVMCNENLTVVWSGRDVFHFPSACQCLLVKDKM